MKYPDVIRDEPHSKPVFFGASMDPREIHPSASSVADLELRNGETKPPAPDVAEPENDKTKPIGRVELTANLADAVPQVVQRKQVVTFDGDHDEAKQKRRLSPDREVARRRKAARRREALACGAGY